jgi:hypothetical protein
MKKIGVNTIGTLVVFVCLLLCTPALADYNFAGWPVETVTNGTLSGGVFIGYEPWNGTTALTGNFEVPNGTVKWARLYTGIWAGGKTNEGWVNVTFNGVYGSNSLGLIHLQGEKDNNSNVWCSGCGKHWMWYNVTELVKEGTVNTATTTKINATVGGFDGRVYGLVLVVVYEGGDNPKDVQYWINDGNDGLHYATWKGGDPTPYDTGTTTFDGTVDTGNVTLANLTVVHLTAYEDEDTCKKGCCDKCMKFNGQELNTSMVDSNTFELNTWDVTGYVNSSGNNAWYTRLDDDCDDHYVSITNAILVLESGAEVEPDLTVTAIKPYHYAWSEEQGIPKGEPWFNLTNYVNITVNNNGTEVADNFAVTLYADEELIGSETVADLSAGGSKDVKIEWVPEGEDPLSWTDTAEGALCSYTDTSTVYKLKAVVDEDNEVAESNDGNNILIEDQEVVWNGFASDAPLHNYVHGKIKGGMVYTTGDGQYQGLDCTKYGTYNNVCYDIDVPGSVKFARLYVYYTWAQPKYKSPKIGVTLNTPSGTVHELKLERSYNDIGGEVTPYKYVWGTYAYNITGYVNESGTYMAEITNLNNGSDSDFAAKYAFAAPAILVLYENATMPEREYWLNEGADILIGGIRSDVGFLSLADCLNNASFHGSINLSKVANATLGLVSPWAGLSWESGMTNYLYFNGVELGRGVYCGYNNPCNRAVDGIMMNVGAANAQVGVNVTDVTCYLNASDNVVTQGDDGDCMMPSNAFLMISYKK